MSEFHREQIKLLTEKLDTIAHAMGRGLSYEDYLVAVGRYKATREQREQLSEQLKKRNVEAEDSAEEQEPPTIRRPDSNHRPRSWGGGRSRV